MSNLDSMANLRPIDPAEYAARVYGDRKALEVIDRQKVEIRKLLAALRETVKYLPAYPEDCSLREAVENANRLLMEAPSEVQLSE